MSQLKNNKGSLTKNTSFDNTEIKHSSKTHISFSFGYFFHSFLFTIFAARVFAFYENEIHLDVTLVLIAYIVYGVWNMVNDPLLGYISDKPNRFWKKWGRRFPWIVAMGLPYCFFIIFIFMPPELDATTHSLFLFCWLLVSSCLYDAFYSGWMTNYYALFPDKFRSDKERRKIAGMGSPLGLLATALGTLLPPLFIEYGNKQSYVITMIFMSLISFITFLITLPGSKENADMRKSSIDLAEKSKGQDSFLQAMKVVGKHKNFLAYLIAYLAFHTLITIMLASLPYIVPFVLNLSASYESVISAFLLVGQLLGVPLWIKVANKSGHRKMFIIGIFLSVIVLIPLIFVDGLLMTCIIIGILGFMLSSIYMGNQLIVSDCIDEIVIDIGRRQEGVFLGVRTFFVRLSIILQAITFWAIHISTGFDSNNTSQTPLALLGLRIQFALIPLIIMLISGILFWLMYDLTPEKVNNIKSKLKELNI